MSTSRDPDISPISSEGALERVAAAFEMPCSERECLDAAVRVVVEALDVPLGKILELDAPSPWLVVTAGVGWQPGTVNKARVPLGSRSQAGLTLRLGSPVVCPDLSRARRFADATLLRRHGVVSGVSTVIGAPERPLGVLSVHTTSPRDFTAGETRFICRAADVIATHLRARRDAGR